jgi:dienelactone hydrolase
MQFYRQNFLLPVLTFVLLSACQSVEQASPSRYEFESIETTVRSRDVEIPVTFVHPIGTNDASTPLLVLAHGHGGTRNEAGGFTRIAEDLAAKGIASIRMDFPGCGESAEPFTENNLTNMLADIQASRNFAIGQALVDKNRVGLLGFSMGGRLVLLLSAIDRSYKVIATWAPAGMNGA